LVGFLLGNPTATGQTVQSSAKIAHRF